VVHKAELALVYTYNSTLILHCCYSRIHTTHPVSGGLGSTALMPSGRHQNNCIGLGMPCVSRSWPDTH
jgi:hypothetical protein